MDLTVEQRGDIAVVTPLIDELDASNASDLKRDAAPLIEAHSRIVFDLTRLRFIDSSGLGAFLSCLRKVAARGGDLKLCGMSRHVRAAFELVRMHRIFEIYDACDAAVLAFAHPRRAGGPEPV